jgi:hypothetical protein
MRTTLTAAGIRTVMAMGIIMATIITPPQTWAAPSP